MISQVHHILGTEDCKLIVPLVGGLNTSTIKLHTVPTLWMHTTDQCSSAVNTTNLQSIVVQNCISNIVLLVKLIIDPIVDQLCSSTGEPQWSSDVPHENKYLQNLCNSTQIKTEGRVPKR